MRVKPDLDEHCQVMTFSSPASIWYLNTLTLSLVHGSLFLCLQNPSSSRVLILFFKHPPTPVPAIYFLSRSLPCTMDFFGSDEFLVMFMPILVYWIYSGIYEVFSPLENYRLHSKRDEDTKNLVSKRDVVKGVLFQQAIQATISFVACKMSGQDAESAANSDSSLLTVARQFFIAMVVFDTWQYFVHRYMHLNKFLYRKIHSWHHRIVAPYAFAAQYNHPVDGIVTETLSGAMAFFISGMSTRTSIFFFSFATIKGIDDHCGLMLPWNPFHMLFSNNTAYHDIHHQLAGSKCNFSQPFFVMWDKILGTYMPYTIERRVGGGFEARAAKR